MPGISSREEMPEAEKVLLQGEKSGLEVIRSLDGRSQAFDCNQVVKYMRPVNAADSVPETRRQH